MQHIPKNKQHGHSLSATSESNAPQKFNSCRISTRKNSNIDHFRLFDVFRNCLLMSEACELFHWIISKKIINLVVTMTYTFMQKTDSGISFHLLGNIGTRKDVTWRHGYPLWKAALVWYVLTLLISPLSDFCCSVVLHPFLVIYYSQLSL